MEGQRNCSGNTANKQSSKIKTTNQIADLPKEIIRLILSRLPVKSLLRFRCVSKRWLYLISSRQFVKSHLEFSSSDADFYNHGIMFTITDDAFDLKQCSISSLMFESQAVASDVDYYPNKSPNSTVTVLGSCNGILCIAVDKMDIFLWNPSTRKSKALPSPDVGIREGFYNTWGFGYSECEDDYKVVVMFHAAGALKPTGRIYSLRTESWKTVEDLSCGIPFGIGRLASGKLYFAASSMENYSTWNHILFCLDFMSFRFIVSLDLESEAYAIVKKPDLDDGCSNSSLGLLGGCLSLLCNYQRTRADVWVLKESWTRVLSIPYFGDPYYRGCSYTNPLLIMPNGEVLFFCGLSPVIYNPKNNSLRRPEISNFHRFWEANLYFESLVTI